MALNLTNFKSNQIAAEFVDMVMLEMSPNIITFYIKKNLTIIKET